MNDTATATETEPALTVEERLDNLEASFKNFVAAFNDLNKMVRDNPLDRVVSGAIEAKATEMAGQMANQQIQHIMQQMGQAKAAGPRLSKESDEAEE